MAKRRSGSAATNSASVGGNAPTPANAGVNIPGFNVGFKTGKSRTAKKMKSMKQSNGLTSGIMRPPS
jgi:hypothetical protein